MSKIDKELLKKEYNSGYTLKELAQKYNCSVKTIRKNLKDSYDKVNIEDIDLCDLIPEEIDLD